MNYDLIVIGFGKAGKTLASKAGAMGKKVALIEKSEKMYGGTCINIGCIPTKKLVTLSKDAEFFEDKGEYFRESMKAKNALITALRAKNYAMLDSNENVDIINGEARFSGKNSVIVGDIEIHAPNIVINTGSVDKKPPFTSSKLYNSTELLNIEQLPKHLVVLGMGFIGLEFASMFANFGSRVTIISRSKKCLGGLDEDVSQSVKEALEAQGIEMVFGANILNLEGDTLTYTLDSQTKTIVADAFLSAFGRTPATDGLNLEVAGVDKSSDGAILTNEFLQTSNPNIYAVGDCKGGPEFTYISLDDFRIVFSHLFGDKSRSTKNRSVWATTTFMDTELSHVGLKESELNGREIKKLKIMMSGVPMAKILANDTGFMKAIVDAKNDEILGVTLHCKNANEIINTFSFAMENKIKASKFKNQIFTHPSITEAINDLFSQL